MTDRKAWAEEILDEWRESVSDYQVMSRSDWRKLVALIADALPKDPPEEEEMEREALLQGNKNGAWLEDSWHAGFSTGARWAISKMRGAK